ncbi:MAG TPA: hypothetical protein PLG42_06425 [Bacteroidales bacterium]|nr:hypothetical protein [Bacteroidales bacterium]
MQTVIRGLIVISFIILSYPGIAQDSISTILEKQFLRIRQNIPSEQKLIIVDSIRQTLDSYVASDTVFNHHFSNLRYLGQITSSDSLLKLLTWNVISADGKNKYYCYFIYRADKNKPHVVHFLSRDYQETPPDENAIYQIDNWYGAIYYDVRPFIYEGEKCYILLAIDYGNPYITRKIIETLKFTPEGKPVFGIPCITDGKNRVRRIIFEYAATAVMSMKFEADTLIVFDHLSPFSPEFKNNRQYYGPDFSFDAYYLDKGGLWNLKEDIDIKNKKK